MFCDIYQAETKILKKNQPKNKIFLKIQSFIYKNATFET